MKIFSKFKDLFSHSATQRKERMVILAALLCFAISGIALPQIKAQEGSLLDVSAVQQEQNAEADNTSSSLTDDKADKKKDSSDQKKETQEEAKEEDKDKKEDNDTSAEKEELDKKEDDKKTSEDSTAANNGSSGSASSSNNNSGSSASAPAKQPENVWVPPVYKTVHHDAVYNTVTVVVCNYCGAEFSTAGEFQAHKDANGG